MSYPRWFFKVRTTAGPPRRVHRVAGPPVEEVLLTTHGLSGQRGVRLEGAVNASRGGRS